MPSRIADPIHDLNQAHAGTIVRLKPGTHVFHVSEIRNRNGILQVFGELWDRGEWRPHNLAYDEISRETWVWPRLGYVNLTSHSIYIYRTPHRQYRSTYHRDSVVGFIPVRNELNMLGLARQDNLSGGVVVNSLFNRNFPSREDALRTIRSTDKFSVAFHPKFCYAIKASFDDPAVYYKTRFIGVVNDENRHNLFKEALHLKEEMEKLVPEIDFNG